MFSKGSFGRKLIISGTALGVVGLGGGYDMYQRRMRDNKNVTAEDFNASQDQIKLQWALSHLQNSKEHPAVKIFRYTTCPWCGTVKSFMDYSKIEHQCVEVEPMFKGELAHCQYKKVPIIRFDSPDGKNEGVFMADSLALVDAMAEHTGFGKQLKDEEITRWRTWARGPVVRFVTLEFNDSLLAAWKGYSYIDDCETIPYWNKLFLKVVGAPVMWLVAMKITKPRLIRDGFLNEGDVPKQRLHQELNRFVEEALVDPKSKKPRTFHGGDKPDLADLDTFGVLQSVRGHRVYNEIIAQTKLAPWLKEMDSAIGNPAYVVKQ